MTLIFASKLYRFHALAFKAQGAPGDVMRTTKLGTRNCNADRAGRCVATHAPVTKYLTQGPAPGQPTDFWTSTPLEVRGSVSPVNQEVRLTALSHVAPISSEAIDNSVQTRRAEQPQRSVGTWANDLFAHFRVAHQQH